MTFSFEFTYEYYPLFVQPTITTSNSVSGNISATVYPDWYSSINLVWKYPSDWGSVTTNIYHCAIESGTYNKLTLTPLLSGVNSLNDTTTNDFSKIYEGWYIIEGTLNDGRRVQSKPVTWRHKRDSWTQIRANEINRREWLLLRKFVGLDSFVFNRKTYGERCKECWSYTVEKVIKDKCETCYGTSFEGGYWNPLKSLIQYESTPNDIQLSYFGKFEVNELAAWTIAYPNIDQRDIIYRIADGKIFEVGDKKETQLQGSPVRQIFKMVELDKESPEFKLVTANDLIPN